MRFQPRACDRNDLCVLRSLYDAVLITDRDGTIEYVNPAFETMTGYHADELIGNTPRLFKSGRQKREYYQHLWQGLLSGRPFRDVFVNRRKDGSLYYEEKTISPLVNGNGQITHFISIGKDISPRIRHNKRLTRMAYYDLLTGLANRALLTERLERAMLRAQRSDWLLAVVFADLDGFKQINDRYGHVAGDRLLTEVADRFNRCVRSTDTASRFSGDEFVLLLEELRHVDSADHVLAKLLAMFAEPFVVNSHSERLSTSLGVVFYPFDDAAAEELIAMADRAMYCAKRAGGGHIRRYERDQNHGSHRATSRV